MCQNEGTHQIVMSFSPPVVGCLLKKAHKRGGHRHPRTPPLATPLNIDIIADYFGVNSCHIKRSYDSYPYEFTGCNKLSKIFLRHQT